MYNLEDLISEEFKQKRETLLTKKNNSKMLDEVMRKMELDINRLFDVPRYPTSPIEFSSDNENVNATIDINSKYSVSSKNRELMEEIRGSKFDVDAAYCTFNLMDINSVNRLIKYCEKRFKPKI